MKFVHVLILLLPLTVIMGGTRQLPQFELYDLDGELKSFGEVKGEKLTVVDFWATWCKPCMKAIPKLNELSEKYSDEGVAFLGINVDSPRNDAKVKPFARSLKINYTVLRDPNSAFLSETNVSGLPTLLIVNADREVLFVHQGYRSGDEKLIEEKIEEHLAENGNEKSD